MAIRSGFCIMRREKPAGRWAGRREGNLQPLPRAISGSMRGLKGDKWLSAELSLRLL